MSSSLVQPSKFASNEKQWIELAQQFLNPKPDNETETRSVELEGIEALNPVTIFGVPKALMSSHLTSYTPQEVSIGPYHHLSGELYDMEWYKVAAAKRKQKNQHQDFNILMQDFVQDLMKHDLRIRASYHRPLNSGHEALAWMMALDASFLFELFEVRCRKHAQSSLAQLIKKSENLTALNSLLRDVVMLENQIPLFVMQMLLLKFQYPSKKLADQELLDMLIEIGQELSPFLMQRSKKIEVDNCAHLLDFLYKFIVPTEEKTCYGIYDFIDDENSDEQKEDCNDDQDNNKDSFSNPKNAWQVFRKLWKFISPVSKKLVSSKPFRLVSQLQPVMQMAKGPVVNILSTRGKTNKEKKEDEESPKINDHMHPTVKLEEIAIPSVSELVEVGVKFKPINDGITGIKFDVKTQVFQIPVIDLDGNTKVVLRNLVAYEAGGIPGPLVLARYIELMNGIIDTDVDAKLLCREGIINNHLKTVKEVADLWNGMSKSIRLTKVESLDKVIEEVNNFYESRWKVKFEKFLKENVFGSWRFLTFLATLALLLLMTLQAFCQVYSCGRVLPIQGLEPLTEG